VEVFTLTSAPRTQKQGDCVEYVVALVMLDEQAGNAL
jgi:hypothetical protein